ncbi:MAG: Fe-S cluster assembly protein SufB [Deltaproteobacteria bacterium]|nr:Fe-S cluster assembly protein SufB [Deltaproteobacteria bacterium]
MENAGIAEIGNNYDTQYGFHDPENYKFKSRPGLTRELVAEISAFKDEPTWMRDFRLKAYDIFMAKPMPTWGNCDLINQIRFDDIHYYVRPTDRQEQNWDDVPADIRKTFDRLGIPEAERKFLAGVTAQYECLTGDTLVMANPSAVPIQEVEPGMHVYSWDETTRRIVKQRVLGVAKKGKRPVFALNVGGRKIRCTANHPLFALNYQKAPDRQRGRFSTGWRYLSELAVGDYVAVVKQLPDTGKPYTLPKVSLECSFVGRNHLGSFTVRTDRMYHRNQSALRLPAETTTALLWLLGLYIGDGFLHRSRRGQQKNILAFAIPQQEVEMRARLKAFLDEVFGYVIDYGRDTDRARIHSIPIVRFFAAIGLEANAHTKRLPQWIFSLPHAQKLAFIAGYIDSDGYLRSDATNCDAVITSVNEPLLKQVQLLAITCGLHAAGPYPFSSRQEWKGKITQRTGYRLLCTGDLQPLVPYSVKVAKGYVPRRYSHDFGSAHGSPIDTHTTDEMGFSRIRSIEPDGEEEVYDIEVEGVHNFVAQGIIVHNSEVVYHSIQKELEAQGVIFLSMDDGLKQHPDLVKKYFATVIPAADNKFAALNSAAWSGGSFIYVPKNTHVGIPLQAYFRINTKNMGQFERTLIICDEGSSVHYIEGCTAPTYSSDSLHSAVVELIALPGAKLRYTTIQNWSKNVYNLVTKRAVAYRDATVQWVDGNLGSKLTMKFPAVYLMEPGAHGEVLSIAFAGDGQHQDAGAKMIHVAPHTSSIVTSKSISKGTGRTSYRGLVKVQSGATGVKCNVVCDALLLDAAARSDTYPTMEIDESNVQIGHEASVSKVGEEQLYYLQSRGLSQAAATLMIVNGFIEPFVKELPLEYAVELNRLIALEMEGSVG